MVKRKFAIYIFFFTLGWVFSDMVIFQHPFINSIPVLIFSLFLIVLVLLLAKE